MARGLSYLSLPRAALNKAIAQLMVYFLLVPAGPLLCSQRSKVQPDVDECLHCFRIEPCQAWPSVTKNSGDSRPNSDFAPFEWSFARLRADSVHRTGVSIAPTFEVVRARPWGACRYAIVAFGREHTLDG